MNDSKSALFDPSSLSIGLFNSITTAIKMSRKNFCENCHFEGKKGKFSFGKLSLEESSNLNEADQIEVRQLSLW